MPRWLRLVMIADRAGSSWYIGTSFFFAPVLALLSPWPTVTVVLWALIALAGLWLGLLGIAMAIGLALVLRSGEEIPEDYWWSTVTGCLAPVGRFEVAPRPRRSLAARRVGLHGTLDQTLY